MHSTDCSKMLYKLAYMPLKYIDLIMHAKDVTTGFAFHYKVNTWNVIFRFP